MTAIITGAGTAHPTPTVEWGCQTIRLPEVASVGITASGNSAIAELEQSFNSAVDFDIAVW